MLELTEIKKIGDIISAIVTTIEQDSKVFEIAVNVKERTIVKNTLGEMDSYVAMARNKLFKLYIEYGEKLPKKAVSAWY